MSIILPEDDELDARTLAILHVATLIEDAMTGRKPVDLYDLTGEIVDHLQPPVRLGTNDPLDRVDAALNALEASNVTISEDALALLDSTEPGAAAARLRELADLIEHCGAYAPPKPRIRVRAATRRGGRVMFHRPAYSGAAVPDDARVPRMLSNVQPTPAQASLLDWITPLGKRLGDCTGHEIAALAALFNELAKNKPVA